MAKKIFITIMVIVAVLATCFFIRFLIGKSPLEPAACTMEAKLCSDGSSVSRILPDCKFSFCPGEKEGILISWPKTNEKIKSPLKIKGEAKGSWFFEAQFNAMLLDAHGNKLAEAILTAKSDWMTENFVPFEGELNFVQPLTSLGNLKFLSANPSGLLEHQKIFEVPVQFAEFVETSYRKVLLYYYNSEKDKDESGNIACSRNGLISVEREIPATQTPIQDTIKLLLAGGLSDEELSQGINTEYPLEGFSLKGASLKDGVLTLEFNDFKNKTVGGSCRVGILWFQIEATAKQFSEVKQVRFLPEEIFQP